MMMRASNISRAQIRCSRGRWSAAPVPVRRQRQLRGDRARGSTRQKKVGWSDHYAKRWMDASRRTSSPGWSSFRSPRSAHRCCCRRCGASRHVARANCLTLCWKPAGKCFDTALRPDVVSAAHLPDLRGTPEAGADEARLGDRRTGSGRRLDARDRRLPRSPVTGGTASVGNCSSSGQEHPADGVGRAGSRGKDVGDTLRQMKSGQSGEKIGGRPHLVPLANQAADALKDLMPLTGRGAIRVSVPDRCQAARNETRSRVALRRLGFDNETMTPHGFRAMARTVIVERLNVAPDVIEAQLARGKSGPLGMPTTGRSSSNSGAT